MIKGKKELFVSNLLEIEVEEKGASINIKLSGMSIDRQPGKFITPILVNVIKKSSDLLCSVINLDYAADLTEFIQDWALRPISRPKRGFSSYRVSGPFLECPAQGLALQAVWGSRQGDGR